MDRRVPADFDCATYKQLNPDLIALGADAALESHYIFHGQKEGRIYTLNLPVDFDLAGYKKYNQDITDILSDLELKVHYLMHGKKEGRIYKALLPPGFKPEIYKFYNPDLRDIESVAELEKHYSFHGGEDGRAYCDDLFDGEFFQVENAVSNYRGYRDYVRDIRQHKSLYTKSYAASFLGLVKDIVLVSHDSSLYGATHSLYTLAKHLKGLNKNFVILDTSSNIDLVNKYGLDESDVISYHADPTILYWLCTNIKSRVILFNSVNFSMSKVYPWLNSEKVVLFSRETKGAYDTYFERVPHYVLSPAISASYRDIPRAQTPILSDFLRSRIDSELLEDVWLENLDQSKITLGMCGSVCARKNYRLFLEVAEKLPDYNFVWIGGESLTTESKNVFHVKESKYPYKYYKLLDYFVLFSEEEPFGNVVIENLYAGNKVLSFKKNIYYNFKDALTADSYFEFDGRITLENAVNHIKDKAYYKVNKTEHSLGREYVLKNFSNYSNHFMSRLTDPEKSSEIPETRTYLQQHIRTKCSDGFSNQLRMLLAGEYLVQENYIQSYTQEWTTSNHNNIDFLDFFEPLKFARLETIAEHKITRVDGEFAGMTGKYINQSSGKWPVNLRKAYSSLKLKPDVKQLVEEYMQRINCTDVVGIHVRRTCKTSANKEFNRTNKQLTNQEFLALLHDDDSQVYVATDNRETQDYFKAQLKDRCVVYQDILEGAEDYCSGEYIREAVTRFTSPLHAIIDFQVLLNCKRFIGTENSSFTALIYHLRNSREDYSIISSV